MENMATKQSIVIDFKIFEQLGLGVKDYMNLVYLYLFDMPLDVKNLKPLEIKKYIKIDTESNKVYLREEAIELIKFLSIKSFNKFNSSKVVKKSKRQVTAEITERIDEYRDKWKGLKPGSMGGKKDCIQKLTRWVMENPEYSFDQVIKAAELYIDSVGGNNTYLQRADYFVFKQDVHKGEASRLSAFIDELEEYGVASDWTSKLI